MLYSPFTITATLQWALCSTCNTCTVWLFQWAIYSHDYIKGNLQQVLPLSKKLMFTSKGSWWAWGWEHLDRAHVLQANNNHSRHTHQTRLTQPDREHTVDCWAIKAAAISCCIPSRSSGSPQIQRLGRLRWYKTNHHERSKCIILAARTNIRSTNYFLP